MNNPTERVLRALPEDAQAHLTPQQWYAKVNEEMPQMTLAKFCEHVRELLDVGFIHRVVVYGDHTEKTIVTKYYRTKGQ